MKKPIIVAVSNYFFPGLGYVLLGQRRIFGWLMMLCSSIQAIQLYIDPYPYIVAYATTTLSLTLAILALWLLQIAFAYDVYSLAKTRAPGEL